MEECPHCKRKISKESLYCVYCKKDINGFGKNKTSGKEIEEIIQRVLRTVPEDRYTYSLKNLGTNSPSFEFVVYVNPKNLKSAKLEIMFHSNVWEVSFVAGNAFFMEWYWHNSKSKYCQLSSLYEAWEAVISGNYKEEHWGKNPEGEWKGLVGIYTTKDGKEHKDGCANTIFPGWVKKKFLQKTPQIIQYEPY